ncbi:MAG: class I SAM-dependent methyltransferase [Chlamydiia bacterium]|nr:class I SAM-dependent methyltransferase [Chlamydiia bacterium]
MKTEIDLLESTPRIKRDYNARARSKTPQVIATAKKFDFEFFDGDRIYGYGGYRYDGRWLKVAQRMIERYQLKPDARILDIGCAKGFLLHDFQLLLPECKVAGIDVSEYAIRRALDEVKPYLTVGCATSLPYADDSFDLVISINTIHNLPRAQLVTALKEIMRVTRKDAYVTVDAWRNEDERTNLEKWVLTAQTMMHVGDWKVLFDDVGYTGDYYWFIAN